jgi:hypothetical protein
MPEREHHGLAACRVFPKGDTFKVLIPTALTRD